MHMRSTALAALAFALGFAVTCPAQVYKWTDPSGHVHYGDKAPEGERSEELKLQVRSYDGPPQVMDWASIIRAKPAGEMPIVSSSVVMYSTSWCPHCKRARAYFASHGIAYRDVDVEKSASGAREFRELGGGGVPLILAGGRAMRGFSEDGIRDLLGR